jgi:hypothetical protein
LALKTLFWGLAGCKPGAFKSLIQKVKRFSFSASVIARKCVMPTDQTPSSLTLTAVAAAAIIALMQPIEVLRPGKATDMRGREVEFTAADLAEIASGYNTLLSQAPIVIGHPKLHDPAYGQVRAFSINAAGNLCMHAEQINADFAEGVQSGAYKQRSISLFAPNAAGNPKPGSWYARHVGFLGAAAPAIKGLAPIDFAAGDGSDGVFSFGYIAETQISLWRRLREYLISTAGLKTADDVLPSYEIETLQHGATQAEVREGLADAINPNPNPNPIPNPLAFSEDAMTTTIKTAQAAPGAATDAALQAANDTIAALRAQVALTRSAAHLDFAQAQVAAGRLLPVDAAPLAAVLTALDSAPAYEFSDATGTVTKQPLAQFVREQFSKAPVVLDFAERAPSAGAYVPKSGKPKTEAEIDAAAHAFAAQNKCSYMDALTQVSLA